MDKSIAAAIFAFTLLAGSGAASADGSDILGDTTWRLV